MPTSKTSDLAETWPGRLHGSRLDARLQVPDGGVDDVALSSPLDEARKRHPQLDGELVGDLGAALRRGQQSGRCRRVGS